MKRPILLSFVVAATAILLGIVVLTSLTLMADRDKAAGQNGGKYLLRLNLKPGDVLTYSITQKQSLGSQKGSFTGTIERTVMGIDSTSGCGAVEIISTITNEGTVSDSSAGLTSAAVPTVRSGISKITTNGTGQHLTMVVPVGLWGPGTEPCDVGLMYTELPSNPSRPETCGLMV